MQAPDVFLGIGVFGIVIWTISHWLNLLAAKRVKIKLEVNLPAETLTRDLGI